MAEVLGVVASVIAILQLTDMVTETAKKYVNTIKGAESVLMPLLGKLRSLSSVLGALKAQLESKISSSTKSISLQHLKDLLHLCEGALTRMKAKLDSLKVVGKYVVGSLLDKQTTGQVKLIEDLIPILQLALDADKLAITQKIKYYVETLQVDSAKQAQTLRDDIQAHHQDALRWKIEADHSREASSEERLREKISNWLARSDPEVNYRSACQRQQPGTGNWLLESKDFREWEAGQNARLWLHAMAGAGKTILSSTIIRHLITKFPNTNIAYFFFDFRDVAKQDVLSLLSSLVIQASGAPAPPPKPLVNLFERHSVRDSEHPSSPTTFELVQVLTAMIALHETFYIVIDALDECRQRSSLLDTISAIFDRIDFRCRILCTSRADIDIQQAMHKLSIKELKIQNKQVDNDVALYVRAVLSEDDRLRTHRQGIKDLIAETLTQGSKGMFRWVQCQVEHIKTLRTARDVKLALKQLPPDLDQTYDNILLSVRPSDHEYLRRALRFIVFSARPMTLIEVAEAVIIEPGMSEIDEDARLQRPEDLLDIGRSIFTQNANGSHGVTYLELSHYSVKEYLLSERARNGPAAAFAMDEIQAEIGNATCCLTYLSLKAFEDEWNEFDANTWNREDRHDDGCEEDFLVRQHYERLQNYPLLDYAAKSCFKHCKKDEVQKAVSSLVRDYLAGERSGRFRNMTYTCVFNSTDTWDNIYMRVFRHSLISVAASYGLTTLVQDLLKHGIDADNVAQIPDWVEEYAEGQTALYRAADFGHKKLCRILIDAGANVNGDHTYDCPLSAAGRSGNPDIVRLIVDAGADVRRDSRPIAETLLMAWWKFAEGDQHWKGVLDVFRRAGAKWLTVGLLAAFSRSMRSAVMRITDLLGEEAGLPRTSLTMNDAFHRAVQGVEINTLTALQWLVQDRYGIEGLMGCVEYLLCATYDSQPYLFRADMKIYAQQKYSAEEVLAENLIRTYFQPVLYDASEPDVIVTQDDILTIGWDNISALSTSAMERVPLALLPGAEAEGLIVCGDILRGLIRDRWVHEYAHFFE